MDRDELRALAAGTPPAPARVVTLDAAGGEGELHASAAALAEACDAGCRITLRLANPGGAECTPGIIDSLGLCLQQEGRKLAPHALALPGTVMHPEELALRAVGACEGAPPVYVLVPANALDAIQRGRTLALGGGAEADARAWWQGLVALATAAPSVSLVPEAAGPGLSLLAPAQRWSGPSPGSGELIPASPCRLRLPLDFGALLDACSDDADLLGRLAGRIVVAADEWLAHVAAAAGPRRLALEIDGIARAAIARGRDPRSFAALSWLKARLGAFRDGARSASVQLARQHGGAVPQPFPLAGVLEVSAARELDRALLIHGARHTHLVSLSPWSLAPPETGRDCLALVAALAFADSVAWRRPDTACAPGLYSEALRFAWAVALRS